MDKNIDISDLDLRQKEQLLKRLMEQKKGSESRSVLKPEKTGAKRFSLSSGQKGLWFIYQADPEGSPYNVPLAYRIEGKMDVGVLKSAFRLLRRRHPLLTARIEMQDGEPVGITDPDAELYFETGKIDPSDENESFLKSKVRETFDLEKGPLMRVYFFSSSATVHILLVTIHHIILDGTSSAILLEDLKRFYKAGLTGERVILPRLKASYADFADWQTRMLASETGEEHKKFWLEKFSSGFPQMDLPVDHLKSDDRLAEIAICKSGVNPELTARLKEITLENKVFMFSLLLSAFKVLLHRYTGQEDILVATPAEGRSRPEFENLVGFFVNMIMIRTELSGDISFLELLKKVQSGASDALIHQDYPFPELVKHLGKKQNRTASPLYQVSFLFQNWIKTFGSEALGDNLVLTPLFELYQEENIDLTVEMFESETEYLVFFKYNTAVFEADAIRRMSDHFQTLLENIADDPSRKIADIPLLSKEEQHRILVEWNDTAAAYPKDRCIHQLIEEQTKKTPDAIALLFEEEAVSYAELNLRSNRLAHYLRSLGAGPNVLVGICIHRSIEMIVGLLGILKAGGAYVPLDPMFPSERLNILIEDSAAALVLTQTSLSGLLNEAGFKIVCMDRIAEALYSQSTDNPKLVSGAENLAYVMFTSGSTGRPKGVQIVHRSVVNFLKSTEKRPGFADTDTMLSVSTISFDITILEFFLPLCTGGKLVIAGREAVLDGPELQHLLNRHEVTVMQATPVTWKILEETGWPGNSGLKAICTGEPLPAKLAQILLKKTASLWNGYGPTEITIWAALEHVRKTDLITVGRPLDNVQTYILDSRMQPVPPGVAGELYVGGDGLSSGYMNYPELTKKKFVSNPFSVLNSQFSTLIYDTGDMARYLKNGVIECLGRSDNQVKIRGFRIELSEIETLISKHPAVKDCVATVRENRTGDKRIVSYAVKNKVFRDENDKTLADDIRRDLREKLPEYMIPSIFMFLDAFPLTPNGKIDRKNLPAPGERRKTDTAAEWPQSETERIIATVWKEFLATESVGIHDNFFDAGGHSFLAVQVHRKLKEIFPDRLSSVTEIFQYPTIHAISRHIHPESGAEPASESARVPRTINRNDIAGDIAIIGMACRFPGAKDIYEFQKNIWNGIESIRFFSDSELAAAGVDSETMAHPDYVKAMGALSDADKFDASFFKMTPAEAEITDPQQRIFLECAWTAMEHAGYIPGTDKYSVGVYAGQGMPGYFHAIISTTQDACRPDTIHNYRLMIGNDKDFLTSRVAYKLNLKGPAVTIQTGCSTSLVAVHMACRGLMNHECDMALAGGVAINIPQNQGYLYQPGMITSPDGHCRAFDAEARGTVFSSGTGAVMLKRLRDAEADGDNILAVIKGSAVNNDGSVKVSYTAPGIQGQTTVIREAIAAAGVSAESISNIEAHGTATNLGDPAEIQALTTAFNTPKKGYCAIGSVKTNIGHTDIAAGVAGLIKTVFALQQRQIPPSLHFNRPNPEIAFGDTPFYVNTSLSEWENSGENPRRAGVSSFGVGGTNAHVILEEYVCNPEDEVHAPKDEKAPCLIVLSARNEDRLAAMVNNLLTEIQARHFSDHDLVNLAYTLQVGREPMEERLAMVADTMNVLEEKLKNYPDGASMSDGLYRGRNKDVQSVFSSDEDMAEIMEAWIAKGKYEKLANLWVNGLDFDWNRLYRNTKPRRISLPAYPFAGESYWIADTPDAAHPDSGTEPDLSEQRSTVTDAEPQRLSVPDDINDDINMEQCIERDLKIHISRQLKISEEHLDAEENLSNFGFDSVSLLELASVLTDFYGTEITPAVFFEYSTIEELTEYISKEHEEVVKKFYQKSEDAPASPKTGAQALTPRLKQSAASGFTVKKDDAAAPGPVAIIGMSGRFPMAEDADAFWRNIVEGRDCITEIPPDRWDWRDSNKPGARWGGFIQGVDEFDPLFFGISPKEAELMDPQQRLLMIQIWKAMEDAAIAPEVLSRKSTGVFIAAGPSEYLKTVPFQADSPFWVTSTAPWAIPNRISQVMNLTGPSEYYDTACSSALVALHRAVQSVRNGECEQAVAGAVNLIVSPSGFMVLGSFGALSPTGKNRSFQTDADGYVRSEGVGAVIIKSLPQAVEDGDRTLAVIRGVGVVHGGKGMSLTAPNGAGMKAAMARAYQAAGIDPQSVSYVEAHGSGTPLADGIEIQALKSVYGNSAASSRNAPCYISSTKPCIGHGETVSGMAALIKAVQAIRHTKIPGIPGFVNPTEYLSGDDHPLKISVDNLHWEALTDIGGATVPRRAGINIYGFGGVNAHLVLEEYVPEQTETLPDTVPEVPRIAVFSAKNAVRLKAVALQMMEFVEQQEGLSLRNFVYTLQTGREEMKYRLAMVVKDREELLSGLSAFLENEGTGSVPVYSGNPRDDSLDIGDLFSGEMGEVVARKFIEQNQPGKLAAFWAKGGKVPWDLLHTDGHRISLPTYPFETRRCWIRIAQAPTGDVRMPEENREDSEAPRLLRMNDNALTPPEDESKSQTRTESGSGEEETVKAISEMFVQLLGADDVGPDSDFFELGGQSIVGASLCRQISRSFNIRFELNELYQSPTPAQMAKAVLKSARTFEWRLLSEPENHHEPFNLTDIQYAYWIGRQNVYAGGNVSCHAYFETDFTTIDVQRLEKAVNRMIQRHGMLRAVISEDAKQRVREKAPHFKVGYKDIRQSDETRIQKLLEQERESLSHEILDVAKGELFLLKVLRLPDRYRLYISLDMLIMDGTSIGIFFDELGKLYANPDRNLPEPAFEFRDYLLTVEKIKESGQYEKDRKYWMDKIETFPSAPELPMMQNYLATDKPSFNRVSRKIPSETWSKVKDKAKESGVSDTSVLLLIFGKVISTWSKNSGFLINMTLLGRLPVHDEINTVIGDFTTLETFAYEEGGFADKSFARQAALVHELLIKDVSHNLFSGVAVSRELSKIRGRSEVVAPVVFTSLLNVKTGFADTEMTEAAGYIESPFGVSQTPQVWIDCQVLEEAGLLIVDWDYADKLFPENMIEDMHDAFCFLVETAANADWTEDNNISGWLSRRPCEPVEAANATKGEVSDEYLHTLFAKQAKRTPDLPAVISNEIRFSYQELYELSARIGNGLKKLGARPNVLIGVVMEKGWEQIPAVMGILSSGAAYLPVNATYPQDRINDLLTIGEVETVLAQPGILSKITLPDNISGYEITKNCFPDEETEIEAPVQSLDDIAYVIFTSGSTGTPKGVVINHRAAVNTIVDINRRFSVSSDDRVLALSALNFDLSVYDIFGLLAAGGAVVMPAADGLRDPSHWAELMTENRVTLWNTVPALMQMLVEYQAGSSLNTPLRLIMMSGDWIPLDLPERIRKIRPQTVVMSLGGATEASIWSNCYPVKTVEPGWASIPYGKPLTNQIFRILNERMESCPIWVPGHLCIGGIGLALGYW
ncbi:MAG: amino acid adenylation domain-containing protein, partial [Gammaproteobacteria bacterium]|nr:amino acid adenylation domain-containing protein [Gammaproteobacteria bacterium]